MTTTPETTADGRLIAHSEDEARVFAAFGTPFVMAAEGPTKRASSAPARSAGAAETTAPEATPTAEATAGGVVAQDDDEASVYEAMGVPYTLSSATPTAPTVGAANDPLQAKIAAAEKKMAAMVAARDKAEAAQTAAQGPLRPLYAAVAAAAEKMKAAAQASITGTNGRPHFNKCADEIEATHTALAHLYVGLRDAGQTAKAAAVLEGLRPSLTPDKDDPLAYARKARHVALRASLRAIVGPHAVVPLSSDETARLAKIATRKGQGADLWSWSEVERDVMERAKALGMTV